MTGSIKLDMGRNMGLSLALAGIGGFTVGFALCRFMTRHPVVKETPRASTSQDKETETRSQAVPDSVPGTPRGSSGASFHGWAQNGAGTDLRMAFAVRSDMEMVCSIRLHLFSCINMPGSSCHACLLQAVLTALCCLGLVTPCINEARCAVVCAVQRHYRQALRCCHAGPLQEAPQGEEPGAAAVGAREVQEGHVQRRQRGGHAAAAGSCQAGRSVGVLCPSHAGLLCDVMANLLTWAAAAQVWGLGWWWMRA